MPSKYILSRLAHTPFREPTASKTRLSQEFIDELDIRRQSIALSHTQEAQDWLRQADEALHRAKSADAKKYVWSEFVRAQNIIEEPHLLMAAYQWLFEHKEWAPRKSSVLEWREDRRFFASSVLCAASQLPNPDAVQYIADWITARQEDLGKTNGSPRMLPVQKIRLIGVDDYFYNHSEVGYENEVLWEHALIPALPYLPANFIDSMNIPYLPFFFEHSNAKTLLDRAPSNAHSWILANGLFGRDFASRKSNVDADNTVIQGLSRLVADISPPDVKAFLAWDMLHRKDDVFTAASIVQIHVPHVHALLKDLGLLKLDSMRQALLTEWHKPSQTLVTLDLPTDLIPSFND